jgi:hypothetical protein
LSQARWHGAGRAHRSPCRRAAEAGDAVAGGGGAVALQVDLQVEPMNMSQAYRPAVCENARLAHRAIGTGEEHIARAAMYFSMPSSEPNECTDSTKPDSMAGISAGCGFSAQCWQIFPFRPSDSA